MHHALPWANDPRDGMSGSARGFSKWCAGCIPAPCCSDSARQPTVRHSVHTACGLLNCLAVQPPLPVWPAELADAQPDSIQHRHQPTGWFCHPARVTIQPGSYIGIDRRAWGYADRCVYSTRCLLPGGCAEMVVFENICWSI